MSGTGPELLLLKHETDNPHYDLLLRAEGFSGRWILRGLPDEGGDGSGGGSGRGEARLALEDDTGAGAPAAGQGEMEDLWGKGPVEIVERCELEIVRRTKRKIIFRIEGTELNGRYCLLLRNWGLHTRRRLWVFFRLRD